MQSIIHYPSLHRKIFVHRQTTFYSHHRFRWKYPLELHNSTVFPSTNSLGTSHFVVVAARPISLRVVVARLANNTHPRTKKWTPVRENSVSPWQRALPQQQQTHPPSEPGQWDHHDPPPHLQSHTQTFPKCLSSTPKETMLRNGTTTRTPSRASSPGSRPPTITNKPNASSTQYWDPCASSSAKK